VDLPRSAAAAPVRGAGRAAALPSLAGASLLCIDNEPGVLDGMRMLLQGWGCRVHLAAGLAEALRLDPALLATLDAIIVDYHLDAEADGLRCLDVMRQRCATIAPAILITADRSAAVREAADRHGLHVLNKPIKPAVLRALVTRIIAAQEAAE
jgi:CheY-like chemotaxis protein